MYIYMCAYVCIYMYMYMYIILIYQFSKLKIVILSHMLFGIDEAID